MLTLILFIASSLTIIGLAAAGLSYSVPIKKSYSMLSCSILLVIDEAL
jgi:hypothetical protein